MRRQVIALSLVLGLAAVGCDACTVTSDRFDERVQSHPEGEPMGGSTVEVRQYQDEAADFVENVAEQSRDQH